MVEPITVGSIVAIVGGAVTAVLGAVGSVVQGIRAAWEYMTIIMGLIIAVSCLAAITGYTTQGVPMLSINKVSVLPDYVFGFPHCASSLGPVEGCILPSKDAIFAFPVALNGMANVFQGKNIAGGTGAVDLGSRVYDFFAAFFGVFLGVIPLFLTLIKFSLSIQLFLKVQDFWTGYTAHALPNRR